MSILTEAIDAELQAELQAELLARPVVDAPAESGTRQRVSAAVPQTPPTDDVAVTVDIYDQTYHLRGQDPAYIESLAEIVDGKMRAVAAGGTTVDSLRVAVLAALNIADELMRMQGKYRVLSGSVSETENSLRSRTANLSGLLDSVLSDDRKLG